MNYTPAVVTADKNMEREIKTLRSGSIVYIICVYLLAMITDIRTLTSKFISDSILMKSKFKSCNFRSREIKVRVL